MRNGKRWPRWGLRWQRSGLTRLSVTQVVAEAAVAVGSFFHRFKGRSAFLLELHRSFHGRLASLVTAATKNLPPGSDHLLAGKRPHHRAVCRTESREGC
jgi:AcrR family transcriptional regulator